MLAELKKAQQLINKSKNIIIIPKEELCGDSLGSALALWESVQNLTDKKKRSNIYLPKIIPPQLNFLLNLHQSMNAPLMEGKKSNSETKIQNAILSKNLIITINNDLNKINTLRYEKHNNKIKIILSMEPEHSPRENDIQVETIVFNYDLIITLGASNLTLLGEIHENHPDFFANASIINIDHHENNWQFGHINLINAQASSTAEITMELINFLKIPITDKCATCLLCGIIEKTQSFRKSQTAPRAFQLASELLNKGGDQELIIRHLYKTKPVGTIKLWGEIMANLKYDSRKKIISALITTEALQKTNTDTLTLKYALKELKDHFVNYNHFLMLWESNSQVAGILITKQSDLFKKINAYFNNAASKHFNNIPYGMNIKIKDDYLIIQGNEKNLYKIEAYIFNLLNGFI